MSKTEDILWVSRVTLLDDTSAFDKLTLKYQSSVRRFLLNLTMGDTALSDDLAQETFIRAYLNIGSFKAMSAFSTWLFRIAYNVFYDAKRSTKVYDDIDVAAIDQRYTNSNDYSPEKDDLYKALKTLRPEERTAVLLHYMEDKTHVQVAQIMNCPLGTVKTYILKGKQKLNKYLTNEGYGT